NRGREAETGERTRNKCATEQSRIEDEERDAVETPTKEMRPVPSGGYDHPDRLERLARRPARSCVRLADGDHRHDTDVLDHRHREAHHSDRDEQEGQRWSALAKGPKHYDRDAEGQRFCGDPENRGEGDLLRVRSGVDKEPGRTEERRLQDEIHQKPTNHLKDDHRTDDATGTEGGSCLGHLRARSGGFRSMLSSITF